MSNTTPVVGLLGAVATTVWVVVAPDNVVGPLADAPFELPATAVREPVDGCVELVDGDGGTRRTCPQPPLERYDTVRFDDAGVLVVDTPDGPRVIDPDRTGTGGPTSDRTDDPLDVDGPAPVYADGDVVRVDRRGSSDDDVVLDLGGPTAGLRGAVASPDGAHVVAFDARGRVLVAEAARPDRVHVWFTVEDDGWFDLRRAVRWDD